MANSRLGYPYFGGDRITDYHLSLAENLHLSKLRFRNLDKL